MFDFHMHSNFSADCSIPMANMIESGIKKGLKEICFTEHIDYDYPDNDIVFEFDLQAYAQHIKKMQNKYQDKITVRKGIELGLQPHLIDRYNQLMNAETFDFSILSIHTVDQKCLHDGAFFDGQSIEAAYQAYYEELLYCVKHFKQFSVLGHLDLVKRYTLNKQQPANNFHGIIEDIFKVIISDGKGIEINTSGTRYGLSSALPSDDILKLYKAAGGEIITLGSDSHHPEHLGYHFQTSLELLDSIGFKYVASFEDMKPTFHSIERLLR